MNQNQIRFVRTLTATWKVLRDPVLTTIYMKKSYPFFRVVPCISVVKSSPQLSSKKSYLLLLLPKGYRRDGEQMPQTQIFFMQDTQRRNGAMELIRAQIV